MRKLGVGLRRWLGHVDMVAWGGRNWEAVTIEERWIVGLLDKEVEMGLVGAECRIGRR